MIVKSVMTEAHTILYVCVCKERLVGKTHKCTTMCLPVSTVRAKHVHKLSLSSNIFHSQLMIVACQYNKHLVTTLFSPLLSSALASTSTFCPYLQYRHKDSTYLHVLTFTHWLSSTVLTHSTVTEYAPTNVTFNGHSKTHKPTYNTLLHREPCCVLSGGTQMAATWCVLMGSCDGSEQDMDTYTDGDPLTADRRWTCWLLICSDQWLTTWSSDTGGVAPTELAH